MQDSVFWMMSSIVSSLLPPGYYSSQLWGAQADQVGWAGVAVLQCSVQYCSAVCSTAVQCAVLQCSVQYFSAV